MLRPSLLLVPLAVWVVPLSGAAAPSKASLSSWTKAKHGKVLVPAKAAPQPPAPASAASKSRGKAEGPSVSGKVAVFGFTGEGAARVQQVVVSTLRTRGLQVTTGLRPVDSAEQYREMAATLRLAAYIDGTVGSAGSQGQATVHVRSGITGRRIASVRFAGERSALANDVGNGLWPRTGSQLARLCAEAAKPRKGGRKAIASTRARRSRTRSATTRTCPRTSAPAAAGTIRGRTTRELTAAGRDGRTTTASDTDEVVVVPVDRDDGLAAARRFGLPGDRAGWTSSARGCIAWSPSGKTVAAAYGPRIFRWAVER